MVLTLVLAVVVAAGVAFASALGWQLVRDPMRDEPGEGRGFLYGGTRDGAEYRRLGYWRWDLHRFRTDSEDPPPDEQIPRWTQPAPATAERTRPYDRFGYGWPAPCVSFGVAYLGDGSKEVNHAVSVPLSGPRSLYLPVRIVWSGLAIDTAVAALLLGGLQGLFALRRRRRRARGECPVCGYSLAGDTAAARCPECGEERSNGRDG